MSDEYISCKTNCPVPVKNVMLGCSGRSGDDLELLEQAEKFVKGI